MIARRLTFFFLLLLIVQPSLEAQSTFLDLLYTESIQVFKGKVTRISYDGSNGQGSYFGIRIKVEKYYKVDQPYKEARIGLLKPDVISVEHDTVIMDYAFQLIEDSTYIFFTKAYSNAPANSLESAVTSFTESEFEGVPFSKELETLLEQYDQYTFFELSHKRNNPTGNFVFYLMRRNADAVVLGKMLEIKEGKGIESIISISTTSGEKQIYTKGSNCVCKEGSLQVGQEYIFYLREDRPNEFRPMDDWLGIIQAGEYDRFIMKN